MIVYQNSLVTLDYLPGPDILVVEWPGSAPYMPLEIREAMQKITDTMQNYQVKHLLIDGSRANLASLDASFRGILADLLIKLIPTPILKLARVITGNPAREQNLISLRLEIALPYQFQDFKNKAEALAWLEKS